MEKENITPEIELPNGVIFNAYPDSIGQKLSDTVDMLSRPEFNKVFSLFYILPTIFNSDLDRGFSIIDYDLNEDLVTRKDLDNLNDLNIAFKFDLVLNHLSVQSPQFLDMIEKGDDSGYRNFFIDWNKFWDSNGTIGPDGIMVPDKEHLDKLFMRKPGLPVLNVRFPDGSERPYWNTFYQEINYPIFSANDFIEELSIDKNKAEGLSEMINTQLMAKKSVNELDLDGLSNLKEEIISVVEQKRKYLGQMDLNAKDQSVWDFYDEAFRKLKDHGGKLIRLDAFAYLHKEPGQTNFFNKPGTWQYLDRLRDMAEKYDLILLPEIHSQYGTGLHEEVSGEGYPIYDFFFPGLVIHALDNGTNKYILKWIDEIQEKNIRTINMLGCHDGIPVLDLNGNDGGKGLMNKAEIQSTIDKIMERGGRVKNLYGSDGKKISYYQVNATFFSALGEDEQKLLLARAIQLFMPGIPQVWYLDLFAGTNDYDAADNAGTAGHKEINRTTLTNEDIEAGLNKDIVKDQLTLMKLRNTSPAFNGKLTVINTDKNNLHLVWMNNEHAASLVADLQTYSFSIIHSEGSDKKSEMSFGSEKINS